MPRIAGHRLRPGGPLVGRQAELAALGTALREAARGHGSVVLVTGEPGARQDPPGAGVPQARGPRHPVAGGLHRLLRLVHALRPLPAAARQLGGRDPGPARGGDRARPGAGAGRGPGLGRPVPAAGPHDGPAARARRWAGWARGNSEKQTFGAWSALTSRLVAAGPAVLVLEDLHWADPTSLRLTFDLARLAAGRRLLILATSRPEAAPALDGLDARRLDARARWPGRPKRSWPGP